MDPMDDDDVPQAVKDAMRLHELAGKQQEEFEAKMAAQAAQAAAPAAPAPVGDPHSGPPAEKRSLVSASGSTKAGNFSAALAAQTPAEKRGALKANSLASVAEASGEGYRPKSPLAAAVARPTVPAEANSLNNVKSTRSVTRKIQDLYTKHGGEGGREASKEDRSS